jgi:hypothetical protein
MSKPEPFIAVLLYEGSNPSSPPLYEERFFLILASSKDEAEEKAYQISQRPVHTYKNMYGEDVTWTCKRLIDVIETVDGELKDGAEIYSRGFFDLKRYDHLFEEEEKSNPSHETN